MKQLQEFKEDFYLKRTGKTWHFVAYTADSKIDFQIESKSLGDILTSLEKLNKAEVKEFTPIIIARKHRKLSKSS